MPNFVEVNYEQTGKSKSINEFGMKEMQKKVYEKLDLAIEKYYRKKPFESDEEMVK